MDQRQFEIAKTKNTSMARTRILAMAIGGTVALAGIGAATYLASTGSGIVAGIIATFLATILAVIVGNKFLGS